MFFCFDKPLFRFCSMKDIKEEEQLSLEFTYHYEGPSHMIYRYNLKRLLKNCDVQIMLKKMEQLNIYLRSILCDPNIINTSVIPAEHKQHNLINLIT